MYSSRRNTLKRIAAGIGLPWLWSATAGAQQQAGRAEERSMALKTVEAVLKEHTARLMSLPGVVGTAHGKCAGRPCIKVFVVEKTPKLMEQIPSTIEGYPVQIQETGEIRAREPG